MVYEEGDVLGDGVNIASRVEPLSSPGGICVTEDVAASIGMNTIRPLGGLLPPGCLASPW